MTDISVILPTYSPGEYLFSCLESLERQTMPKHLFEVLIVLNGIKEPFHQLLSDFITKSELHSTIYYTDIKGVSNARNIALNNTNSEYITFIDDDDIVSPNYLEGLYRNAENGSMVISNFKTFQNDISDTKNDYLSFSFQRNQKQTRLSLLKARRFFSNVCGKMIPVDVIGDVRFDSQMKNGEDSVFIVEISRSINNIFIATDDVIYYRRIRDGSASRSNITTKKLFSTTISEIRRYISFCRRPNKLHYNVFILSRILASVKSLLLILFIKFR